MDSLVARLMREETFSNHLAIIHHHCVSTTLAQFELFQETAYDLLVRYPNVKGSVENAVSQVAKDIRHLGDVNTVSSKVENRRLVQVEILIKGLERLESLLPPASTAAETFRPGKTRKLAEGDAIDKDRGKYERSRLRSSPLASSHQLPGNGDLLVTVEDMNMEKSKRRSLKLKQEDYPSGYHIIRHLRACEGVKAPDLWTRYEHRRAFPSGLFWEWLPSEGQTEGNSYINYVERATKSHYIVALKVVSTGEASPEPLDLASEGDPCCDNKCGNLQAHLSFVWPQHFVTKAFKIRGEQQHEVLLTDSFDGGVFDYRARCLSLLVYMEPLP